MRHITAAFAFAGICVLGAACSSGNQGTSASTSSNQGTSAATSSTRFVPVSFGTAPPAAPASPGALAGLLLSPFEMDNALGAALLIDQGDSTAMSDDSANVTPTQCVVAEGAGQATVYAGSGYTAIRGQLLRDGPTASTSNYSVDQVVVSFPSATAASAFFTASARRWQACTETTYTYVQTGQPDQVWNVGEISNTPNGILSTITTAPDGKGGCERALTVANNIAIDVNSCSDSPEGVAVAQQIAAKVSAQ